MKKLLALISVLSIFCITPKFTYGAQYWDVTYGGYYDDFVRAIQQTTDGGYIVAGYTESFSALFSDLWLFKIDEDGNVIWQKTYGGDSRDKAHSVFQTSDGGYVVAGSTFTYGAGYYDIWVLKLDSIGDITWQKAYGGSDQDEAYSIQQTADGGYVAAGYTQSFDTAYYPDDIWVLKLDGNGNVSWQKTYSGDSYDRAYSIQQTADGGYVVAGETMSFGAGVTEDILVLKLDASGNVSWQKTYGELWEQGANDIQQTLDGGYILAGYHRLGGGNMNIWILKLDSNGVVSWQKTYDSGYAQDNAYSIRQTSDGGYIIQAILNPADYQVEDRVCVLKLDESGNISWQKTYGGNNDTQAYSIRQTLDEGYIVAAEIKWRDIWRRDIWLLKLDNNGEIPGCPIMDSINLNVVDTNVVNQNSDVTIQSPSILISNTNATVNETLAELSVTCTAQIDPDNDEILYDQDNCPYIYNPEQTDTDNDAIGDVCDQCPYDSENDSDGDGICGDVDNCPDIPNPEQEDAESDGVGDVCDEDDDNDGQFDTSDNCPYIYNPNQEDNDDDGIGDVCDSLPNDYDNDGVDDNLDNCLVTPNPTQIDSDSDAIGDSCDNCLNVHNPDQADYDGDKIGDACDVKPQVFNPLPSTDGNYFFDECCHCCGMFCHDWCCYGSHGIVNGIFIAYFFYLEEPCCETECSYYERGLIEFDIANIEGLLLRGQLEALLYLTVKDGELSSTSCLSLSSMQDENEDGVVSEEDIYAGDYIGEVCENLQPGDTITIDITSAIEHDLFDPEQTNFSGFLLSRSTGWIDYIEFYDRTDPDYAPRLIVIDTRKCEGNFDCDDDCDGTDAALFKADFGRSTFLNPCTNDNQCQGDFDCDVDVDGTDAALFKSDFGRSEFSNPCPVCEVGDWCVYPFP